MKTIYSSLAKLGFAVFAAIMFILVASFTKTFAESIYGPGSFASYAAIALADAGALVWIAAFVYAAETTSQRTTAFIMFVADLMISALMIIVSTVDLAPYPELPGYARVALAMSGIANLAAAYWFHMHGAATEKQIEFGQIVAETRADAIRTLRAKKAQLADRVADLLGERLLDELLDEFTITRKEVTSPDDPWEQFKAFLAPTEEEATLPSDADELQDPKAD